jgi:hypothetical protein
VTIRNSRSPGAFRRVAALALAVTLAPLPLAAAERASTPAPAQPLRTSIAKHASREALVASPKTAEPRARQTRRQRSNNPQSSGFFRSPTGIACLAVIAAGTGYALYSVSHDRIHSVAREGQK